jgi:hypothetical protein
MKFWTKIHEIETFNLQDGSELLPIRFQNLKRREYFICAMMQINQDGEENKQLAAGLKTKALKHKKENFWQRRCGSIYFASTTVAAEVFPLDHGFPGSWESTRKIGAQLKAAA